MRMLSLLQRHNLLNQAFARVQATALDLHVRFQQKRCYEHTWMSTKWGQNIFCEKFTCSLTITTNPPPRIHHSYHCMVFEAKRDQRAGARSRREIISKNRMSKDFFDESTTFASDARLDRWSVISAIASQNQPMSARTRHVFNKRASKHPDSHKHEDTEIYPTTCRFH